MEKEVAELQVSTNLFDVTIPDFRDIKLCRREIVVLKELWDIVVFVQVSRVLSSGCSIFTILEKILLKTSSPHQNTPITQ